MICGLDFECLDTVTSAKVNQNYYLDFSRINMQLKKKDIEQFLTHTFFPKSFYFFRKSLVGTRLKDTKGQRVKKNFGKNK